MLITQNVYNVLLVQKENLKAPEYTNVILYGYFIMLIHTIYTIIKLIRLIVLWTIIYSITIN